MKGFNELKWEKTSHKANESVKKEKLQTCQYSTFFIL